MRLKSNLTNHPFSTCFLLSLLIIFLHGSATAQVYYNVTHTSGTQTIGSRNVTVTGINSPSTYLTWCGYSNPYWIGSSSSNGYMYAFSTPANRIRMHMGATNTGEIIRIFINGSQFLVTSPDISAHGGSCSVPLLIAVAGDITTTTPVSPYANGTIDITSPNPIDSIRVMHMTGASFPSGTVYDFAFAADTTVDINQPFNDTLLCAGDTVRIPYSLFPKFSSSNIITAQLSNASGSFATPVTIGTRSSDTSGIITCVIPIGTATGGGYRIRLITSSPARISADNGKNIGIGTARPVKPITGNNGPMCSGNTLNLTASTTTSGVSWKWTGPNSFTSTLQNPSITNAQAVNSGSYIVTAYIYGCVAKDTTNAAVAATVGAAVATSNAPICDNDTLRLSCSGTGTVISYTWTGPSSFSSSLQNPILIHPTTAATGDYYLSVALSGCTILDTVSVLIKPTPVGLTASSNTPVCAGDSIKLYAGSTTPGVTYLWTGPNGYSVFVQNPYITNAASVNTGTYTVTYLLNGCNATNNTNVIVNPKPAPVTATVNGPICAGSTLNLASSTTTSGVSYSWIGPNSFTSSTQNPNITNAQTLASGDYIVTAALGLCNVKDTVTALVKPMPANTSASNNGPVCQGSTLSLAANTSSSGVTYSWIGPNSFTSTQQNPNITNAQPTATGNYIVTFNLNGCSSNANTGAIVTAIPAKPTAGSNTPVCAGTTLNLTASIVPGSTYSWTGPAGFSSLLQNPSVNNVAPANAGPYIVRAVNGTCYSLPDTTTVTVIPAPNVSIYPNPNDTICLGSNVTFVAVASNAGTSTSYRWLKNNVPTAATTTSYSSTGIANNDVIFCELTANGVCASSYKDSSNAITMTVLPWLAPSVSITSNPSTPLSPYQLVQFTANATNAGTTPAYQWKRNGADVQGATSFTWGTYQLSDNDDITVVVTSSYMCPQPKEATSNTVTVQVLTGIDDIENKNKIALYPNPNNGSFNVTGSFTNSAEVKLEIVNAIGQVVYKTNPQIIKGELKQAINVQHLAKGIYLLRISNDVSVSAIRFSID